MTQHLFWPACRAGIKPIKRATAALGLCLSLGGCASYFELFKSENTSPPFREQALSMPAAASRIAAGTSTKADVLAALGPAKVISFDSGFEVWVYKGRYAADVPGQGEFVVLFAPSGVATKFRLRLPQKGT